MKKFQKTIRKILHHADGQITEQLADEYPATDEITKERIYNQICERRNAMKNLNKNQENQENPENPENQRIVSEIPWARTLGIAVACVVVMSGTVGGIWKLSRMGTPDDPGEFTRQLVAESNLETDTTAPAESALISTTTGRSVNSGDSGTSTTQTVTSTTDSTIFATDSQNPQKQTSTTASETSPATTAPEEATMQSAHQETVGEVVTTPETEQVITHTTPAPAVTTPEIQVTEPDATAPPKPAYYTAYLEICEQDHRESDNATNIEYGLYDIDKDGTPEFIINHFAFYMSIFSYADNQVYTVMDHYPYGVAGNFGYTIYPFKNCIYYAASSYAGLIHDEYFLTITPEHTLETTDYITCYMFHDDNNDGVPQEEEINTDGSYSRYELNGVAISKEEYEQFCLEHSMEEIYSLDMHRSYDEMIAILKS